MGAHMPRRRKITAREAAARLGIAERTVVSWAAEPRPEYLSRTQQRRLDAAEMRDQGKTYAQIAEALGVSPGNARVLVHRGRQRRASLAGPAGQTPL